MRQCVPRSRMCVVVGLILGLSLFPMSPVSAAAFSPAACEIAYMGDPHVTSSPGVLSVKANSKIQCTRRVDDLVLTVRLYRADPERRAARTTADNSDRAYIFNEKTHVGCTTRTATRWFAKAWGSSFEDGRVYFSNPAGIRSNTVELECGVK